jgi:hypothetical protein
LEVGKSLGEEQGRDEENPIRPHKESEEECEAEQDVWAKRTKIVSSAEGVFDEEQAEGGEKEEGDVGGELVVELEQERAEGEDAEQQGGFARRQAAGGERVKNPQEEREENQVDEFETENIERTAGERERREQSGKAPWVCVWPDEVRGLAHREGVALNELTGLAARDADGLHQVGSPVISPVVIFGEEGEGEQGGDENNGGGEKEFFHVSIARL